MLLPLHKYVCQKYGISQWHEVLIDFCETVTFIL